MKKWYEELARYQRGEFEIIVDKTWEDIHPRDCFDDTVNDIADICDRIDRGVLDWFMLRVRVMVEDLELGADYLGGCLYEDAREVLTDGTVEDLIHRALEEAKPKVWPLMRRLQALNEEIERETI